MKKVLSLILAIVLIAGIFTAMPVISSAAGHTQTEKEDNDSFRDAQLITPGNTMNGELSQNWDVDCYKLISNEDGKINLTFTNNNPNETTLQGTWEIVIYDSNEKAFAMKEYDMAVGGTIVLPFIGAQAGHYYYIEVYSGPRTASGGHKYTIKTSFTKSKFYEKEGNASELYATKYILANKYTGVIGSDSNNGDSWPCFDQDMYNIKAPAKGTMTLSFNHKKKNPQNPYSAWYINFYKHHNGGNLTVYETTPMLNGDASIKFYKATVKKGAEFWLRVMSAQDISLGYTNYTPLDIVGEPYNITSTFVLAAKPSLSAKATKNSITLTSKKLADVTGYEIQMKNGKKFKKIATTKKPALNYKKSGLKKNTKYTFKVRAYLKKDGTTYYGNWVTKTAKTKKK